MKMYILALAFVTGLAGATCWIPGACVWILPFFLVPGWAYMSRERRPLVIFAGTLFAQTVGGAIGFYWINRVLTGMFGFPAWGGVLGLLLFASIGQMHMSVAHYLWAILRLRIPLKPWASYLVLAGMMFLCESVSPLLFPFNFGYPWMWSGTHIAQLASIIGFSGLSLFTYWLNAIFTLAWLKFESRNFSAAVFIFLLGAGLILTANFSGMYLKSRWNETDRTARIGYAQGSLTSHNSSANALGPEYRTYELNQYVELTNQAIAGQPPPDFFIWPENVLLLKVNSNDPLGLRIRDQVRSWNFPLIAGLQAAVDPKSKIELEYGSVVTYERTGEIGHIYNKVMLVPLGEFIPWTSFLPAMKMFDLGSAPMISGGHIEGGVSKIEGLTIGTNICFESLDPVFAKVFSENGAQMIINLSSDIWFGQTLEPYQHFYMSMARAIESRRPVVRIANTGISGYALANGDISILAYPFEIGRGIFDVQYRSNPEESFFNRNSSWLKIVLLLITLSPLIFGRDRRTEEDSF